jgi:hypothetical protein
MKNVGTGRNAMQRPNISKIVSEIACLRDQLSEIDDLFQVAVNNNDVRACLRHNRMREYAKVEIRRRKICSDGHAAARSESARAVTRLGAQSPSRRLAGNPWWLRGGQADPPHKRVPMLE